MPISDNTLKELEQILAKRKPYQVKKFKDRRDIDIDNATIGDVADLLATLISDLKNQRILK